MAGRFTSVDEYLASFPPAARAVLEEVRRTIHRAAPEAEEAISYQIPTFKLDGKPVVYFAGWKHHISLYPVPEADGATAERLARYQTGKGTLRFPLDQPVPYDLVAQVVALLLAARG
jgi:uncharacterized protein YdhG (YjbR/CyaY superfamily)